MQGPPQQANPKEVAAKANNLYGRDKLASKEINQDLYYIYAKPRLKKPEIIEMDEDLTPEQDAIERTLYARLQDHRGKLFPFLGGFLRICVYVVLFPLFFIKMVFDRIKRIVNYGINLLVVKLTPPYQYCYQQAMRIYQKSREVYLFCGNQINKLVQRIVGHVQKVKLWLRVLFRYANRVLEDWTLEVKNRFSSKTK